MTADDETPQPQPGATSEPPPAPEDAAEAELRAAYEAELARTTTGDLLVQVSASLINLGATRLGLTGAPEAQRDLAQVRDAIDAVRAILPVLERTASAEHLRPLRDALSQLQLAFAREVRAAAPPEGEPPVAPGPPPPPQPAPAPQSQPAADTGKGPAEASGRLWVPGRG